jgi:RNA polymerase sigma-70 factor (ECF subfamily)
VRFEFPLSAAPESEIQLLIERARGGDTRAFEDLARREERALYRHALRIVGTTSDAEDVVQDALFSAWRSIASFQGLSFRAWLFRIATNRALDQLRSRKRRPELPLEPPEDDDVTWAEPVDTGPDLNQLAGDREALALVETALGALPAEQRTALLLRDVEGFPYEDIAVITSVEIGTVKSRIHRGRLAVRNALIARGWRGPEG